MNRNYVTGTLYALSAYLIWGFLSGYWKLLESIPPLELIAHRIMWAVVFSFILIVITGRFRSLKALFSDRKRTIRVILCGLLLAGNWFTYVWGLSHGYVLDASLGYYINPLVSVLLGLVFLKEKLNTMQKWAVVLAFAGVAVKTVAIGRFPFIALILAFSFGFYGLLKKTSREDPVVGIACETLMILPAALAVMFAAEISGTGSFMAAGPGMKLLVMSTGIVTILPLILFGRSAGRIPLVYLGFLQFIAPTIMLLFGIFLYGERMSGADIAGFSVVWAGVFMFLFSYKADSGYNRSPRSTFVDNCEESVNIKKNDCKFE